jgi:hypothetical protein
MREKAKLLKPSDIEYKIERFQRPILVSKRREVKRIIHDLNFEPASKNAFI